MLDKLCLKKKKKNQYTASEILPKKSYVRGKKNITLSKSIRYSKNYRR